MQNTTWRPHRTCRIRAETPNAAGWRDRASRRPGTSAQCGLHFHFSFIESHR
jgi:hypothetical protein